MVFVANWVGFILPRLLTSNQVSSKHLDCEALHPDLIVFPVSSFVLDFRRYTDFGRVLKGRHLGTSSGVVGLSSVGVVQLVMRVHG